jgi:hypothetical protein
MPAAAISKGDRPVDWWHRLVHASLPALVFALSGDVAQFEASKECRGGTFSSGFSILALMGGCDVVARRFGDELARIRLSVDRWQPYSQTSCNSLTTS